MSEIQNIQWFPGHMAKAERSIKKTLPLIDAVAEITDARIPVSSRNPDLDRIVAGKPRIIVLNKCDMADDNATTEWIKRFEREGAAAIAVDCRTGRGIGKFTSAAKQVLAGRLEAYRAKGMTGKTLRVMVVGIPNVGKSTFINRIAGVGKAKSENRPGVTKGNQWYSVDKELELLDTPGVLWPKFEDQTVGEHLAFVGSVKSEILDTEGLAVRLCELLLSDYSELVASRYGVDTEGADGYELLCRIGKKRGYVVRGGLADDERTARMLLDEFKNCKIGRITVEKA